MAHALTRKNIWLKYYAQLYAKIHCQYKMQDNILKDPLIVKVLTQYRISKGIEVFGDPGVEAVIQEMKQLHEMMAMDPKDPEKMSGEEKKAALQYLIFLKQKRCGKIKSRGCSDGQKQIDTLSKTKQVTQ